MLIADCMTRQPILVAPTLEAIEAHRILVRNHIRHLPVVDSNRRLVGLITRRQLHVKTDAVTRLNFWEIAEHLSQVTVSSVMLKAREVITIGPERTIEHASQVMADARVGCLPVVDATGVVLGIITESDLLWAFQEIFALSGPGLRVTVRMEGGETALGQLLAALAGAELRVMRMGAWPARNHAGSWDAVLKVAGADEAELRAVLASLPGVAVVDLRAGK